MATVRWLSQTDTDTKTAAQLARLLWLHELRMQRYNDAAETLLHVSAEPEVWGLLHKPAAFND